MLHGEETEKDEGRRRETKESIVIIKASNDGG